MDITTESFEREVIERSHDLPIAVFRDGAPVTGFVGAYPASTIGRFFDEQVLADRAEPAEVTA